MESAESTSIKTSTEIQEQVAKQIMFKVSKLYLKKNTEAVLTRKSYQKNSDQQ